MALTRSAGGLLKPGNVTSGVYEPPEAGIRTRVGQTRLPTVRNSPKARTVPSGEMARAG